MPVPNEVIILVPGINTQEKNDFMENFCSSLSEQLESFTVQEDGEIKIAGHTGKRFSIYNKQELYKTIDIYEGYYMDVFASNKLSQKDEKTKFIRGGEVLIYWLISPIWLSVKESPSLFINFIISAILFTGWYYGILAAVLIAIGQTNSFFGAEFPLEMAKKIGFFGESMKGWSFWFFISILSSFLPISSLIDICEFSAAYLGEDTEGSTIRSKTRGRVLNLLEDVLKSDNYDRATILAYSFGVAVATDTLADYHSDKTFRYITLGGTLKVLSYKSNWGEREINKCLNNATINTWIDCYSNQDWVAAKTPLPKGSPSDKMIYKKVYAKSSSLLQRFLGKTHVCYFYDSSVWETIIR
ncbi:hypothetical protein [Microcoleus sp. bin38.metabat.b11b12b14.051]|uniref:hypothetical protein n=1 Tax=Microcoleus sp. bin38.metabat.b11b12b14.051 TaxID=2742709 RepID=UPI0025E58072|nr:hypothetical protein [Microcoleus sp. bin38.metabat.b11b12b14.051]